MAVLAVAAAGAAAGYATFGAATFLGVSAAGWGWALGSVVGNALFAPKTNAEGPRLTSIRYSQSAYGATLPIVLGAWRTGTNIIWMGELEEVASRQKVGKRAYQTTYSYRQSFAAALCAGPIAGVRRIWFDSELVYSNNSTDIISTILTGNLEDQMTLYLGDETQVADAVIEAELGVGQTPAYRGVAYLVFERLDLTPWGNRIPAITAEVIESGAYTSPTKLSELALSPGPVFVDGQNVQYAQWTGSTQLIIYTKDAATGTTVASEIYLGDWSPLKDSGPVAFCTNDPRIACWDMDDPMPPPGEQDDASRWVVATQVVDEDGVVSGALTITSFAYDFTYAAIDQFCVLGDYVYCIGRGTSSAAPSLYKYAYDADGPSVAVTPSAVYPLGSIDTISGGGSACVATDGTHVYARWSGLATKGGWTFKFDANLNLVESINTNDWSTGQISFAVHDGHLLFISHYFEGEHHFAMLKMNGDGTVTEVGENTTAPAVDNGDVVFLWPAGGGVVMSNNAEWSMVPVLSNAGRTLAQAITSIAADVLDSGQIDVTDVAGITLHGTALERRASRRSWIETLCAAYGVDAVESNGKIAFRQRGAATVATIQHADLGAMREAGDADTPSIGTEREQQAVLPQRVDVSYADIDAAYEIGAQPAVRGQLVTDQSISVELPIAMTAAVASRAAHRVLYEAHASRSRMEFSTDMRYAHLEPTDAVLLEEADGSTTRMRILSKNEDDGLLAWAAVADDDGTQIQVVDGASLPSPGTVRPPAGSTRAVVFETPPLNDDHVDKLGVYVCAAPYSGAWPGGSVWINTLGEADYAYAGDLTEQGVIGQVTAIPADLADAASRFDPGHVDVLAFGGTPASASSISDWLTAGTNLALIGRELVQFRSVTDFGNGAYRLAGLIRQCHGTIASGHAPGEVFALVDPIDDAHLISRPLAQLGAERVFRAVTAGQSVPNAAGLNYTLLGRTLKPLSPCHVNIVRAANGDRTIRWTRRARAYQDWIEAADIPLVEASESYRYEIRNASTDALLRSGTTTSASLTYTSAQWDADFTGVAPATIRVRIWQQSAVVGDGEEVDVTLTWPSDFNNTYSNSFTGSAGSAPSGFTVYSGGGSMSVETSGYDGTCLFLDPTGATYDVKAQCTAINSHVDGELRAWVKTGATGFAHKIGMVARTTNWWTGGKNGFGLFVYIDHGGYLRLASGTNANSNTLTEISNYNGGYAENTWHYLVWKYIGNSHQVWVNGTRRINTTSATYASTSGLVGFSYEHGGGNSSRIDEMIAYY